jgi:hypothetical protein
MGSIRGHEMYEVQQLTINKSSERSPATLGNFFDLFVLQESWCFRKGNDLREVTNYFTVIAADGSVSKSRTDVPARDSGSQTQKVSQGSLHQYEQYAYKQ